MPNNFLTNSNKNLIDLRNLNINETEELAQSMGQPSFRGRQIFKWVSKGIDSFSEMKNIPKKLQQNLEEYCLIENMTVAGKQLSKDGTCKYLLKLRDNNYIEAVFMEYSYGNTICISSQVGCRMGCDFCASTKNGLVRDLTAGEMIGQVLTVTRNLGKCVNHVVVMGIGEPFDNYDNLCRFIELIHSEEGLNMGLRNITVSTCGLIEKIGDFAKDYPQVNLAISLHGATDEVRQKIMPIANKYSIEEIVKACKKHISKTGRRITFEYALIEGINDGEKEIENLAKLLKGMLCHINLITLNKVSENSYLGSDDKKVNEIFRYLDNKGIPVTIRRKLGEDIDAACGQLRLNRE